MNTAKLSGKKRKLTSFIQPFEQYVLQSIVPRVPKGIETYHLTLMTIPFSAATIGVGYLARMDRAWLPAISLFIFLQYVADILDGAVGRYRNTGLVRWGFYMDHLMDYFFACAIVASYAIAFSLSVEFLLIGLLVASGAVIHELLKFITNGEFNISGHFGFGPTEIRLLGILANFVLPFFPKMMVMSAVTLFIPASFVILVLFIYRAQRMMWQTDMMNKHRAEKK